MIKILPRLPVYKAFYHYGSPKILPMNYTLGLLYRCNSRCKTCNIYKKKAKELTVDEYDKIFKSLGKSPYWVTLSGGEPFLRNDIDEISERLYHHCKPNIINIPTNGILYEKIPPKVAKIAEKCPKSQIIINLSLDEVGEKHDEIRGISGNFERSIKTWKGLKKLNYKNLALGIHTVISVYNVKRIPKIEDELVKIFQPDSFITEIAEERNELDTMNAGITPALKDYEKAINYLQNKIKQTKFRGISKITQSFRLQYYDMVKRILQQKRQIIPCYAGIASAQISPEGDVWGCCIRAESMGNLRDNDYNFGKVWFSKKANKFRKSVKNKECYCPLANASYTNMLFDPKTLFNVGLEFLHFS